MGDLTSRSLDLLFDILEQPEPILSGVALADFYPEQAKQLIAHQLIVCDGYEAADSIGEDEEKPIALDWSEEYQSLGYFNPAMGWVSVEPDRLTRYRVCPYRLAAALLQGLRVKPAASLTVSAEIWDYGNLTLPYRAKPVRVLLLPRVHDPIAWRRTKGWLVANPQGAQRVLLCACTSARIPDERLPATVFVSVRDLIGGSGTLRLDPEAITSCIDSMPAAAGANEALVVIGEGMEVRLFGQTYKFARGVHQRRIICALYQQYLQGEMKVSTAWLVEELELKSARIRDYFKKSRPPVMGELLWEKGGLCGFCLRN
jgi:hypothetical protein